MNKDLRFIFLTFFAGLVLSLIFHGSVSAGLKFERFSNMEGFNQNTINAIEEDKYGFLWFGTPNGLIKYDGYDFYNFTHDPNNENGISNNYIQSLYSDAKGVLWIGTREGLNVYIPSLEKFLIVPIDNTITINLIKADTEGRMWVSGENALFICELVNSDNEISFNVSDNLLKTRFNNSWNNNFCFINNNSMLASLSGGLVRIEYEAPSSGINSTITAIDSFSTLANVSIKAIYKIDNIFWIGTGSGLYKTIIDGDRMRIMQKYIFTTWDKRVINDLDVLAIFQDKQKNIWIGSAEEGIFKFNAETEEFENYGYNPKDITGISSSRINCFYQDRFDVLWIGTAQGGVNKLDIRQKQFLSYSKNPYDDKSISGNLITGILEDSRGKLWLTTYNESVCRSINAINDNNVGQILFERLENQIPIEKNDIVLTVYEDNKGFIWLGANNSVVVFNPANNQFKQIRLLSGGEKVSLTSCRIIHQINESSIVLGGDNTVVVIQNPWENIQNQKNPGIEADIVFNNLNIVQTFLKDSKNNFWIGTSTGLIQCNYKDNKFNIIQKFTTNEPDSLKLSHNNIFSLYEDNTRNIWVGTFGGGLNKLTVNQSGNPTKIEYFRKNGLLPDDAVYRILQEDDEHLWISTDMGLCRLNMKENKIDLFDVRDGLPNNNFRQSAFLKGVSGYYYFGGLNGLTIFKPEMINLNDVLPKSVITGISINNNRIKIGEKFYGKLLLNTSPIETKEITFNHRAKILTFDLAAQHSTAPTKNKLAYLLEGFNNEWIETEKGKTSITYTNLPPGNYILRVKSANGDGLWNNEKLFL